MRAILAAASVLAACAFCACAPTMPTYAGGSTTPTGRGDVMLGGAYRIPTGSLSRSSVPSGTPERAAQTLLGREGPAPIGVSRYGLSDDADFSLAISTTQVALSGRASLHLDKQNRGRILFGFTPTLGWLGVDDVQGFSLGAQLPILATIQISGVYEGWAGVRGGIDFAQGEFNDVGARAIRGFVGGVVGFGVGFRSFAALVEVAVDYEIWDARMQGLQRAFVGVSLTPAFALRLRI